jgi:trimeric autotransporter adhesin
MTFVRDLSGNNPTDLKYSPYNRTAADLTAVLALTPLYPGEIVEALNTGRKYRGLGPTGWGLIGPVTSVVAGTLPQPNVVVSKAGGQADPTSTSPILFNVVFSQDVTGFVPADVSFTGSTAGGTLVAAVAGGPNTYVVTVTGMTTPGSVAVTIPAGSATGPGGLNTVSNTATCAWVADVTPPAVTINKGAGQADPTSASPIVFDVVFSEPVTGFTTADISFSGSTAGGTLAASISGTGPTYTVSVTGMTTDGNVIASIPAASVVDLAGNPNTASTSTDNIVAWVAGGGPAFPDNQTSANEFPILFV